MDPAHIPCPMVLQNVGQGHCHRFVVIPIVVRIICIVVVVVVEGQGMFPRFEHGLDSVGVAGRRRGMMGPRGMAKV